MIIENLKGQNRSETSSQQTKEKKLAVENQNLSFLFAASKINHQYGGTSNS